MNIVLIADGHPREWPVLGALSRDFPETTWIHPTYAVADPEANHQPKTVLNKQLSWWYRQFRDRVRRRMTKWKVGQAEPDFKQEITLPYFELGREKGLQLLDDLNPDVIVACRAPILAPEVLQKANWCGINVHFGILPAYRGNDGLFWAAKKRDTEALGGSIHFLEDGVDTGYLIADAFPELSGRESETMIELKVSDVLSRTLVECLKAIERDGQAPAGKPHPFEGRNYLARERTFTQDLGFLAGRLVRRMPAQKERQLFY
ncbi:MAG TPA: formyltransferase family protein [Balneolaceae bacterium]|nr:formyltransferase family protein [Balneolaceae bacterium]